MTALYAEPSTTVYYSPDRLHRLLRSWDELVALAETPQSAHALTRSGPTPIEPRTSHTKRVSDPLRWADVVADVERAYAQLSSGGYGPLTVAAAMTGTHPSAFALTIHARKSDVLACYRSALDKMAHYLDPRADSCS